MGVAAVLVCVVALWIVVPAPVVPLLVVAVVASELSPFVALAAALIIVLGVVVPRGLARRATVALGAVALAFALVPLLQLPATIRACDAELRAFAGRDATAAETGSAVPFDLRRMFGPPALAAASRVTYGVPVPLRGGGRLAFDVYRARLAGPRPTIVLLYGGAWQFGTRRDVAPFARELAARGYTAIAAEYRLAPAHRFPAQLDDVRDALATIAAHAAALGVDRNRVALAGESAGAELALLAAYLPERVRIGAVLGIYAPLDLRGGYLDPPRPDPANVRAILRTYLGGPPEALPAAYAAASPRTHVRPGLPPTLLIGGRRDELVKIEFAREMAAALRTQHDRVAALEFPWSNHGFAALGGGLGGQLATYYSERFFAETIGR